MSDDGIRYKSRLCVCVSKGDRGVALLPRQAGSEAEVDGQAIQPPFTFNERAPRLLLVRSLVVNAGVSCDDGIANISYENRQRCRFIRVSAL